MNPQRADDTVINFYRHIGQVHNQARIDGRNQSAMPQPQRPQLARYTNRAAADEQAVQRDLRIRRTIDDKIATKHERRPMGIDGAQFDALTRIDVDGQRFVVTTAVGNLHHTARNHGVQRVLNRGMRCGNFSTGVSSASNVAARSYSPPPMSSLKP